MILGTSMGRRRLRMAPASPPRPRHRGRRRRGAAGPAADGAGRRVGPGEGAGQLHELPDATASALRGRFLAAHAGVLLARGQRPASEQGLFLAKRVAGLGAFVRTSQGAVQPYAAQGRRGTPEAELPRGSDFWHQDRQFVPGQPCSLHRPLRHGRGPRGGGRHPICELGGGVGRARGARAAGCPPPGVLALPRAQRRRAAPAAPARALAAGAAPPTGPQAAGLLRELLEHALRPEFVFRHRWSPGETYSSGTTTS
ncbi:unnamed protein product [Prorocentrum cordatum]|uniref:Uncharacterized protein n=2 Tax=Prorocentrum cordatum TaxID=2364126 RepID=A0ABN9XUK6_9DINO|nr:unnamed protein product [Polarella glacialis]